MNKGKSAPWIVAGIVVAGACAAFYAMKKNASKNMQSPTSLDNPVPPPITPTSPPATSTSNTASSPIGKNAYVGSSGLIVRSSPEISNGFLGFGNNNVGAVNKIDTLLGVVQTMESDRDADQNPSTGKPFVWYKIKKDPALKLLNADGYYVREDYTTLK